jgi:DNA ligase (NAD+)
MDRTGKEKLPMLMGSLNQIRTEKEWRGWKAKFPSNRRLVFTEKIDGNSCLLKYVNGTLVNSWSRGDGVHGASNIRHTSRMRLPQFIPTGFTGFIRGEFVIPKKDWLSLLGEATREYANARNFVAGFLNTAHGQPELYKYFRFVAFEIVSNQTATSKIYQLENMTDMGFDIPYYVASGPSTAYSAVEDIITTMIARSEYELDGVVADVEAATYRNFTASVDELNPDYSVKIKLISDGVETEVLDIEWSISKGGLLKPVVVIAPVVLDGAKISRVTAYNAGFVVAQGIGVGAIVRVVRSGAVIPKIVETIEPAEVILPPGTWNKTKIELISISDDNDDVLAKQMEYFFSKMEIPFIGDGAISKLFSSGHTQITQIINTPEILEITLGENGRKAVVEMRKILSSTTPQRLFAALGVFGRGVGERKLKVVFDKYSVEQVLSGITVEDYCELSGYDVISAGLVHSNTGAATEVYEKIKGVIKFAKPVGKVLGTGVFSNEILVATGVRLSPEVIEKVQAQGGVVSDSFGKTTTILIAKDPRSTSGKMGKAHAMGIKVISLAQLMDMV